MRTIGLGQKQGERVAPDHEAGMISPQTRTPARWSGGQPSADADLLSRWCEGDAAALEELIRRHGGMVLGVCRRVLGRHADAEDAFQATFLVFVRKVHTLARPAEVAAWLHQVSLRVARKTLANRTRLHACEGTAVDVADPRAPDPADGNNDLRRVLDEELDRLPEKYRLPIVLCELEERTLEEAGHILGWPKGTVACRLSRGRELLRERLSRRGVAPALMSFLPGCLPGASGDPVPDQLVSATLTNVRTAFPAGATQPGPPRTWRHLLVLLLVLFAGGSALGVPGWYLQAAQRSSPVEPKSFSTAPRCCRSSPTTSHAGGRSVAHP